MFMLSKLHHNDSIFHNSFKQKANIIIFMAKKVILPEDECSHKGMGIEWWYFNGFLEGKQDYAFMTTLFKADQKKLKLGYHTPFKTIYFSHSLLFNLKTGEVQKEVLPLVLVSDDSFKKKDLFINYVPLTKTNYVNYEIARYDDKLRIKTRFFDLMLKQNKKPLLENQTGYIDLGSKTTYYYTYSNMSAEGNVGNERVKGLAWHDRQWSDEGYKEDAWLWFSIQAANNTEIVCFDYKGKKLATISYPNGKLKTVVPEFKPIGRKWTSNKTKLSYDLEWEIKAGEFTVRTKPIIKNCEMNFGIVNYWEGPLSVSVNGKKARGFMEYLAQRKSGKISDILSNQKEKIEDALKSINIKKLKI